MLFVTKRWNSLEQSFSDISEQRLSSSSQTKHVQFDLANIEPPEPVRVVILTRSELSLWSHFRRLARKTEPANASDILVRPRNEKLNALLLVGMASTKKGLR